VLVLVLVLLVLIGRGASKNQKNPKKRKNKQQKSNPGKKQPTDFRLPLFFVLFWRLKGQALCASASVVDMPPHVGTRSWQ
jgi:hypothetical protein